MKILLLEDDLELCKNIKISLEKENYMVDCCNDGETAMLYALIQGSHLSELWSLWNASSNCR